MFFQLYGECYFKQGQQGGVIYHLLKEEIISLTKEEVQVLLRAQKGEECRGEPLLEQLQEMEWGFFSEKKVFIDKLRPYNSLMLLRRDLMTVQLETVFLQLTAACSCGEEHCREMFCTPCRTADGSGRELSSGEWREILKVLAEVRTGNVILTGGDLCRYEKLGKIIGDCRDFGLRCSVVLNHFHEQTISQIPEDVPVMVYVCKRETWEDCINIVQARHGAVVILNEKTNGLADFLPADAHGRIKKVSAYSQPIGKKNIRPCNMETFYGRRDGDLCLKGKMYICASGDVVPCFQNSHRVIGNLLRQSFRDVYRRLVEECWQSPVQHDKCRKCDLFYACSVCKCMDPDKYCNYGIEKI